MAKYIAQYPGYKDTLGQMEDFVRNPNYPFTRNRWLRELKTAERLNANDGSPLEGDELDNTLEDLRTRLLSYHPVLPILAGEINLDDPERQKPLVFKLVEPSVKDLNEAYGVPGADAFMAELRVLLKNFFSPDGADEDKSLGFLSEDFKGGVAILNLNAKNLYPHLEEISFSVLTTAFQEELVKLFYSFETRNGGKFHAKHGRLPVAKVVFGSTDWLGESKDKSLEDLVDSLLLATAVSNTKADRLKDEGVKDRTTAAQQSEEEIDEYFRADLAWAFSHFFTLWNVHKTDPNWKALFRLVPVQGWEDFQGGVPLPSLYTLQLLRKDKPLLRRTYPFLTDDDVKVLDGVVRVSNRVDVLKPFVAEHKHKTLARLAKIADLLKKEPELVEDKQQHLTELAEEAKTSLKNEARERDGDISQTRLAIACEVLAVTRGGSPKKKALLFSDIRGASDQNRQRNMTSSLRFAKDTQAGAFRLLLNRVGDETTTDIRGNEEYLVDIFTPSGKVTVCSAGGDEGLALVTVGDDFGESLKAYAESVNARLVVVHLPAETNWSLEQTAEFLAEIEIAVEKFFTIQKKEEAKDKENPMSYPVNINVTQ